MTKTKLLVGTFAVVALLGAPTYATAQASKPSKVLAPQGSSGERSGTFAIEGLASSARNCVGPSGANVHAIGWVPGSTQVVITFVSDFDPIAGVTVMQLGQDAPDQRARASFVADDDGGGNLEPEIRFTTSFSGTLTLHVSKFSAERQAGCYHYKVEIRTP